MSTSIKSFNESPPVTPDSTTEPPPRSVEAQYEEGEDVFLDDDSGNLVFGTIGRIEEQMCQLLFGDGTQQWASFKRIRKITFNADSRHEGRVNDSSKTKPAVKTEDLSQSKLLKPLISKPASRVTQSVELTCSSCGIHRRISQKKARQFEGSSSGFKCRRCFNQNPSNPRIVSDDPLPILHLGPYIKPGPPKNTLPGQRHVLPNSFQVKQSSQGEYLAGIGRNHSVDSTNHGKISSPGGLKISPSPSKIPIPYPHTQTQSDVGPNCFDCKRGTKWSNSVQCKMCEQPCHLSCLGLQTPPLRGDKFWDIMCTSCGTQNEGIQNRVFSVRRKITSWSDIAYLIISCLSVDSKEKEKSYFDLNLKIIPFLEEQLNKLQLPKPFKQTPSDERKKLIEKALNTTKLWFVNGKESGDKRSITQWTIRCDQYQSTPNGNKAFSSFPPGGQQSQNSGLSNNIFKMKRKYVRKESALKICESPPVRVIPAPLITKFNNPAGVLAQEESRRLPPLIVAKKAYEVKDITKSSANSVNCDSSLKPLAREDCQGNEKFYTDKTPSVKLKNSRSSSSCSSTSSSSTSSTTSVEEPLPSTPPRRGRPKGRVLKRSSSSSQDKRGKVHNAIAKKKKLAQDEYPFYKIKTDTSPVEKEKTPSPTKPCPVTLSPVRPVQKVATPTKVTSEIKVLDTSDEQSSSEDVNGIDKLVDIKNIVNVEETNDGVEHPPRGFKTTSIPIPGPRIQILLRKEQLKPVRPGRPKLNMAGGKLVKHGIRHLGTGSPGFKSPLIRLRPRARGRPAGSKNRQTVRETGLNSAKEPIPGSLCKPNSVVGADGVNKYCHVRVPPHFGKRNLNSTVDKNKPKVPERLAQLPSDVCLNVQNSLFDAALYGKYRLHCLPPSPETVLEKRNEVRKVFAHYRTEKEDGLAALLLSKSETETRSQSRRKSELFGLQKRDLNDPESYDVLGKRVDPDGTTRYFIAWKIPGLDDESDSDDGCQQRSLVTTSATTEKERKSLEDEHEEIPQYLTEVERKVNSNSAKSILSLDIIDLTDSS